MSIIIGFTLQKLTYTQDYYSISFAVQLSVGEDRKYCRRNVKKMQHEIAKILKMDDSFIELTTPIPTSNGMNITTYVYRNNSKVQYERILINANRSSLEIGRFIKD